MIFFKKWNLIFKRIENFDFFQKDEIVDLKKNEIFDFTKKFFNFEIYWNFLILK